MLTPCCLLAMCVSLAAQDGVDPVARLPVLEAVQPSAAESVAGAAAVAPGIATTPSLVVLDGTVLVDSGPVDGLEVIACLQGGKDHESLVRLATANGQLVKFAVIRVLGKDDGVPAAEASGQPARGYPMRLRLQWPKGDPEGEWVEIDASCLVRDRVSDRPYPPLPFIYTGSRVIGVVQNGPDGRPVKLNRFMLDSTKSVTVVFDEPDALFASPFPGTADDSRFEAYAAIAPRPGSPCRLVISAAELPLTLVMDADGALRAQADTQVLADADLKVAMQTAFPPTYAGLRAVAVAVARTTAAEHDVAARERLLSLAVEAGIWAVPVFVPTP